MELLAAIVDAMAFARTSSPLCFGPTGLYLRSGFTCYRDIVDCAAIATFRLRRSSADDVRSFTLAGWTFEHCMVRVAGGLRKIGAAHFVICASFWLCAPHAGSACEFGAPLQASNTVGFDGRLCCYHGSQSSLSLPLCFSH